MKHYIIPALALSAFAFVACSDDNFVGDPVKDLSATTEVVTPTEEAGLQTYYTPAIGRVGDPMPFYDKKAQEFKVLYLQEYDKNDDKRFHPIWTVSTKDGVNYQSLGETLAVGANAFQQDAALGTGCCYYNEKDGLYYIYYTGHNGNCKNREVVMRATSPDYKTWTRDNSWSLCGPDFGCSGEDFRDPQIFEDNGVYHMVIVTRQGDPKFADFTSTDMKTWEFKGTFNAVWDRMCECPDIFEMNGKWYFIYSEGFQTDWSRKVKYMMADSFEGLKRCFSDPGANWPKDDKDGVLDSRAFYAGKTASDGKDRYIWGWCPYRSGNGIHEMNVNVGEKEPNWSGALVCHKIIQHEDGTLTLGEVPAMAAKFNKQAEAKIVKQAEDYTLYSRLGYHNHISFTVKTAGDADRWGVSFVRGTEKVKNEEGKEIEREAAKYYSFIVNPEWEGGRRKVNFEQEGAEGKGFIVGGDGYIFPRPADNTYKVDIYNDNSVVTMYIGINGINGINGIDSICGYTQRIYGIQNNCWSINNYGNAITVSDVKVSQY